VKRRTATTIAFAVFAAMILLSNWLLHVYGLIPVGFGWKAPAGTVCAALSFPARDILQRVGGRLLGLAAVFVGAGLAWIFAPDLAVASAVAYLCSEGVDFGLFTLLGGQTRKGRSYLIPAAVSVLTAAVVDSVVFLHIAGIPWAEAGPGLIWLKCAICIVTLPVVFWLRDIVPTSASAPAVAGAQEVKAVSMEARSRAEALAEMEDK
jgi:uncharacterized PurR-regulated membrane protein YhhQ (DUF165 family)